MAKQSPLISIVIPTYNGLSHLKICLPSLRGLNYPNYEILIVDNNSSDGSVQYISKNFPKMKLLRQKENYGYAKGNDIGFKKSKGQYVIFLSNDTKVDKNFAKHIVEVFDNDGKVGVVQSKILLLDTPDKLDSVGMFFTGTGFLYHYGILKQDSPKYRKQIEMFSAKGACMTFRREVLDAIKVDGEIFDNRFFAYFEETDMCHRALLAGFKIVYAPKSIIYHKMGGTSSGFNNAYIQFHSFKNRINAYIKNLELATLVQVLPIHIVLCELIAISYLLRANFEMFRAINVSFWWNIAHLVETLQKRKYIQEAIRTTSDREIFMRVRRDPPLSYYKYLYIYRGLAYFRDPQL